MITKERFNEVRGMEFDYTFAVDNLDTLIAGVTVKAYVADADYDKGISIMATVPGIEEEDIVIRCFTCGYEAMGGHKGSCERLIDGIYEGCYSSDGTMVQGQDASGMARSCPFS